MTNIDEKKIVQITDTIQKTLSGEYTSPIETEGEIVDDSISQLIKNLNILIKQHQVFSECLFAISSGDLHYKIPKGHSKLLYAIKDLQSHLLHLTWQTQQVSKGDYSQSVDFMGEFSEAFNSMTRQLKSSFEDIKQKNIELTESERKLKEAIGTKDKLFSIIAHDLRGPIGNFMGVMDILTNKSFKISEEDQKDFLEGSKDLSERTFNLLENLLNWSKSQTGSLSINPQKHNIQAIVKDTLSLLNPAAKNKSISIISTVDESVDAYFDAPTITTVIRNLISNAIKFTRPEGTITISSEYADEMILISVSDNGVGITKDNIDKLFIVSKNVTTPGTKGEKGTGLGLILCKEFVEKNNGKIWAESETGKGTSFKFTIPIEEVKN